MSYNNSTVRIIEAETLDQRIERLHEYQDKNHKWANVEAVLTKPEGSYQLKEWIFTHNIVTTAGDQFYAQKAASETPTNDFAGANGRFVLRTGAATPAKGHTYSNVTTPIQASTAANGVIDATYPKTNDTGDTDNTGDGPAVVSWRKSWGTADFNATGIIGGAIHIGANGNPPTGTTALLTHFSITSFDKTSSDTLKLFVNHSIAGV